MRPHLIMPMGGAGSRFQNNGIEQPKPLIEIHGKPFLYWSTLSITKYVKVDDIIFIVLRKHVTDYHIDQVIKSSFPEEQIKIVVIDDVLPGPVYTALKGVEMIKDSAPIVINDCDHMFCCEKMNGILNDGDIDFDGALLTFLSHEPQFSYVAYDADGNITGTVEKKVVSDHAICGAYIFRNASLFMENTKEYVMHCPYDECFMSGVYNEICSRHGRVKDYLLDFHVEFGTPEEYEKAKTSQHFDKL